MRFFNFFRWFVWTIVLVTASLPAEGALRDDATAAMRKAAGYYRDKVAVHGGYVYHYTLDFDKRWGEGLASADQVWVQPPGTPTVGLAFLKAYAATGDKFYLDAAKAAGDALVYGQLKSGGWTNNVDFDPRGNQVALYRNGKGRGRNNSTLDDGITQGAIRLLVRLDEALEFKDAKIHESAKIALDALLAAQFPNGAFPQVWTGPVTSQPVVKPSYPDYEWRTEGKIKNYWDMYTLNDNVAGNVTAALLEAWHVYKDDRYKQALVKLGDFLVLAQMPEPQPAWCQQYNYEMKPIWARRFEPPAVCGSESQDVMESLMKIHSLTNDRKYLEPIQRAIEYLRKSQLADGRLARYYELHTNRPLYMTRRGDNYSLTNDDRDLPDHYGWKGVSRLDAIEARYKSYAANHLPADETIVTVDKHVQDTIAALDAEGRWVSTFQGEGLVGQPKFRAGDRYLSSAVFSENLIELANYIRLSK